MWLKNLVFNGESPTENDGARERREDDHNPLPVELNGIRTLAHSPLQESAEEEEEEPEVVRPLTKKKSFRQLHPQHHSDRESGRENRSAQTLPVPIKDERLADDDYYTFPSHAFPTSGSRRNENQRSIIRLSPEHHHYHSSSPNTHSAERRYYPRRVLKAKGEGEDEMEHTSNGGSVGGQRTNPIPPNGERKSDSEHQNSTRNSLLLLKTTQKPGEERHSLTQERNKEEELDYRPISGGNNLHPSHRRHHRSDRGDSVGRGARVPYHEVMDGTSRSRHVKASAIHHHHSRHHDHNHSTSKHSRHYLTKFDNANMLLSPNAPPVSHHSTFTSSFAGVNNYSLYNTSFGSPSITLPQLPNLPTSMTTTTGMTSAEELLQKFELLVHLGRGTFADVTLARHKKSKQLVALKRIPKQKLAQANLIDQTFTERRLLISLKHPFLVRLFKAAQSGTHLYFMLQFGQGGDFYSFQSSKPWIKDVQYLLQRLQYPYYTPLNKEELHALFEKKMEEKETTLKKLKEIEDPQGFTLDVLLGRNVDESMSAPTIKKSWSSFFSPNGSIAIMNQAWWSLWYFYMLQRVEIRGRETHGSTEEKKRQEEKNDEPGSDCHQTGNTIVSSSSNNSSSSSSYNDPNPNPNNTEDRMIQVGSSAYMGVSFIDLLSRFCGRDNKPHRKEEIQEHSRVVVEGEPGESTIGAAAVMQASTNRLELPHPSSVSRIERRRGLLYRPPVRWDVALQALEWRMTFFSEQLHQELSRLEKEESAEAGRSSPHREKEEEEEEDVGELEEEDLFKDAMVVDYSDEEEYAIGAEDMEPSALVPQKIDITSAFLCNHCPEATKESLAKTGLSIRKRKEQEEAVMHWERKIQRMHEYLSSPAIGPFFSSTRADSRQRTVPDTAECSREAKKRERRKQKKEKQKQLRRLRRRAPFRQRQMDDTLVEACRFIAEVNSESPENDNESFYTTTSFLPRPGAMETEIGDIPLPLLALVYPTSTITPTTTTTRTNSGPSSVLNNDAAPSRLPVTPTSNNHAAGKDEQRTSRSHFISSQTDTSIPLTPTPAPNSSRTIPSYSPRTSAALFQYNEKIYQLQLELSDVPSCCMCVRSSSHAEEDGNKGDIVGSTGPLPRHPFRGYQFALDHSPRVPLRLLAFYAVELALVLEYIHEHQYIYRDLKPENILMQEDGHVLLTDFGVAKDKKTSASGASETGPTSRANTFAGTKNYMSPEVLLGVDAVLDEEDSNGERVAGNGNVPENSNTNEHPSVATETSSSSTEYLLDWWSYGCVLFEWCNGRRAFDAQNEYWMFKNIVEDNLKINPEEDFKITQMELHGRVAQLRYRFEDQRECVLQMQRELGMEEQESGGLEEEEGGAFALNPSKGSGFSSGLPSPCAGTTTQEGGEDDLKTNDNAAPSLGNVEPSGTCSRSNYPPPPTSMNISQGGTTPRAAAQEAGPSVAKPPEGWTPQDRDVFLSTAMIEMLDAMVHLRDLVVSLLRRDPKQRLFGGKKVLEHRFFQCPYIVSQLYYCTFLQRRRDELRSGMWAMHRDYLHDKSIPSTPQNLQESFSGIGATVGVKEKVERESGMYHDVTTGTSDAPRAETPNPQCITTALTSSFSHLTTPMKLSGANDDREMPLLHRSPHSEPFWQLQPALVRSAIDFMDIMHATLHRPFNWRSLFTEKQIAPTYAPLIRAPDDLRYFPEATNPDGANAAKMQRRYFRKMLKEKKKERSIQKVKMDLIHQLLAQRSVNPSSSFRVQSRVRDTSSRLFSSTRGSVAVTLSHRAEEDNRESPLCQEPGSPPFRCSKVWDTAVGYNATDVGDETNDSQRCSAPHAAFLLSSKDFTPSLPHQSNDMVAQESMMVSSAQEESCPTRNTSVRNNEAETQSSLPLSPTVTPPRTVSDEYHKDIAATTEERTNRQEITDTVDSAKKQDQDNQMETMETVNVSSPAQGASDSEVPFLFNGSGSSLLVDRQKTSNFWLKGDIALNSERKTLDTQSGRSASALNDTHSSPTGPVSAMTTAANSTTNLSPRVRRAIVIHPEDDAPRGGVSSIKCHATIAGRQRQKALVSGTTATSRSSSGMSLRDEPVSIPEVSLLGCGTSRSTPRPEQAHMEEEHLPKQSGDSIYNSVAQISSIHHSARARPQSSAPHRAAGKRRRETAKLSGMWVRVQQNINRRSDSHSVVEVSPPLPPEGEGVETHIHPAVLNAPQSSEVITATAHSDDTAVRRPQVEPTEGDGQQGKCCSSLQSTSPSPVSSPPIPHDTVVAEQGNHSLLLSQVSGTGGSGSFTRQQALFLSADAGISFSSEAAAVSCNVDSGIIRDSFSPGIPYPYSVDALSDGAASFSSISLTTGSRTTGSASSRSSSSTSGVFSASTSSSSTLTEEIHCRIDGRILPPSPQTDDDTSSLVVPIRLQHSFPSLSKGSSPTYSPSIEHYRTQSIGGLSTKTIPVQAFQASSAPSSEAFINSSPHAGMRSHERRQSAPAIVPSASHAPTAIFGDTFSSAKEIPMMCHSGSTGDARLYTAALESEVRSGKWSSPFSEESAVEDTLDDRGQRGEYDTDAVFPTSESMEGEKTDVGVLAAEETPAQDVVAAPEATSLSNMPPQPSDLPASDVLVESAWKGATGVEGGGLEEGADSVTRCYESPWLSPTRTPASNIDHNGFLISPSDGNAEDDGGLPDTQKRNPREAVVQDVDSPRPLTPPGGAVKQAPQVRPTAPPLSDQERHSSPSPQAVAPFGTEITRSATHASTRAPVSPSQTQQGVCNDGDTVPAWSVSASPPLSPNINSSYPHPLTVLLNGERERELWVFVPDEESPGPSSPHIASHCGDGERHFISPISCNTSATQPGPAECLGPVAAVETHHQLSPPPSQNHHSFSARTPSSQRTDDAPWNTPHSSRISLLSPRNTDACLHLTPHQKAVALSNLRTNLAIPPLPPTTAAVAAAAAGSSTSMTNKSFSSLAMVTSPRHPILGAAYPYAKTDNTVAMPFYPGGAAAPDPDDQRFPDLPVSYGKGGGLIDLPVNPPANNAKLNQHTLPGVAFNLDAECGKSVGSPAPTPRRNTVTHYSNWGIRDDQNQYQKHQEPLPLFHSADRARVQRGKMSTAGYSNLNGNCSLTEEPPQTAAIPSHARMVSIHSECGSDNGTSSAPIPKSAEKTIGSIMHAGSHNVAFYNANNEIYQWSNKLSQTRPMQTRASKQQGTGSPSHLSRQKKQSRHGFGLSPTPGSSKSGQQGEEVCSSVLTSPSPSSSSRSPSVQSFPTGGRQRNRYRSSMTSLTPPPPYSHKRGDRRTRRGGNPPVTAISLDRISSSFSSLSQTITSLSTPSSSAATPAEGKRKRRRGHRQVKRLSSAGAYSYDASDQPLQRASTVGPITQTDGSGGGETEQHDSRVVVQHLRLPTSMVGKRERARKEVIIDEEEEEEEEEELYHHYDTHHHHHHCHHHQDSNSYVDGEGARKGKQSRHLESHKRSGSFPIPSSLPHFGPPHGPHINQSSSSYSCSCSSSCSSSCSASSRTSSSWTDVRSSSSYSGSERLSRADRGGGSPTNSVSTSAFSGGAASTASFQSSSHTRSPEGAPDQRWPYHPIRRTGRCSKRHRNARPRENPLQKGTASPLFSQNTRSEDAEHNSGPNPNSHGESWNAQDQWKASKKRKLKRNENVAVRKGCESDENAAFRFYPKGEEETEGLAYGAIDPYYAYRYPNSPPSFRDNPLPAIEENSDPEEHLSEIYLEENEEKGAHPSAPSDTLLSSENPARNDEQQRQRSKKISDSPPFMHSHKTSGGNTPELLSLVPTTSATTPSGQSRNRSVSLDSFSSIDDNDPLRLDEHASAQGKSLHKLPNVSTVPEAPQTAKRSNYFSASWSAVNAVSAVTGRISSAVGGVLNSVSTAASTPRAMVEVKPPTAGQNTPKKEFQVCQMPEEALLSSLTAEVTERTAEIHGAPRSVFEEAEDEEDFPLSYGKQGETHFGQPREYVKAAQSFTNRTYSARDHPNPPRQPPPARKVSPTWIPSVSTPPPPPPSNSTETRRPLQDHKPKNHAQKFIQRKMQQMQPSTASLAYGSTPSHTNTGKNFSTTSSATEQDEHALPPPPSTSFATTTTTFSPAPVVSKSQLHRPEPLLPPLPLGDEAGIGGGEQDERNHDRHQRNRAPPLRPSSSSASGHSAYPLLGETQSANNQGASETYYELDSEGEDPYSSGNGEYSSVSNPHAYYHTDFTTTYTAARRDNEMRTTNDFENFSFTDTSFTW